MSIIKFLLTCVVRVFRTLCYIITLLVCLGAYQDVYADSMNSFYVTEPQTGYECLAEALYFEAASDGQLGMYLVGLVIINRYRDTTYEFAHLNTICDVVHQPANNPARPWECAFSYYCDDRPELVPDHPLEQEAKGTAQSIAFDLLNNGYNLDLTGGALYYTQPQIQRDWMKNTVITINYLGHTFRKPLDQE